MSHVDSSIAPAPAPAERALTVATDGAPQATLRLLSTAIGLLSAQVETLRQRNAGQPAAFFSRWTAWRTEWEAFARRQTELSSSDPPMSAEDRARLRRYAEQYESVRQGVVQALALPWQRSAPRSADRGGWPWWLWALLLGGGAAAAYYATRSRTRSRT